MKLPSLGLVSLAALVAAAPSASAQVVFLQNDNFVVGGSFTCNLGIGDTESLAAKFTAVPAQYPYTIDRIRVLGCGNGQNPYNVFIYQDDGSGVDPGPLLWQSGLSYLLNGNNTFQDIIVSGEPIPPPPITSGTIRVRILNVFAIDPIGFGVDSAITAQRNFIYDDTGTWHFAENQGVTGDWILRVGILNPSDPCLTQTVVAVPDGRITTKTLGAGTAAWFGASLQLGNSYSVEVKNTTGASTPPGTLTIFSGDDGCSGSSSVVVNDTTLVDPGAGGGGRRMSFTAAGTTTFFRALIDNGGGPSMPISFTWSDTTLFSPAWTTNGSFDTYYSFQNTTAAAIAGTLTFRNASGAVLSTFPVSVPAGQTASVNTSSLGVTRNRTGTARLSHNGPPGAILSEAVIANFSISPAYVQPVKFEAPRQGR